MEITSDRKRRSEKLTQEERRSFRKYVESFDTKQDCAIALGITRPTLDNIIHKGSGRPDTVQIIRDRISEFEESKATA